MSTVTIKVHINEDLLRSENFDKNYDRCALIEINRNDVELETLTEDIPRAFREHKDIKSILRDPHFSIHYYSHTEGEVEIDNNDDLVSEIDVIFPEQSSDEDSSSHSEQNSDFNAKYVNLRAIFERIKSQKPNQANFERKQDKTDLNCENKQEMNKYQHRNRRKRQWKPKQKMMEAFKLDILPYQWQVRMDIKDEGINDAHLMVYECEENNGKMCYWKDQTFKQSLFYEQRYNKHGTIVSDKQSFTDSFGGTVRRRTVFKGTVLSVNKLKGYGYVTPNYAQPKSDKIYGIFFHFEQAFPGQYRPNVIIPCEQGWTVEYGLKMFNKIQNNHKFKKNGFRAVNFKVISNNAYVSEQKNAIISEINDSLKQQKEGTRFKGEIVQVLKDKRNGYLKGLQNQTGLIVFKFGDCHGFDAFDLCKGVLVEYGLRQFENSTCAVHVCLDLLPYQWLTMDEKDSEWEYESMANSEYLERNYNRYHSKMDNIITHLQRQKKRVHKFQRKVIRIEQTQKIGYVEMNDECGIGLIFSFNDCNFDWNKLRVGKEVLYELQRIENNEIVYWKVINIEEVPKYRKIFVWKWMENENEAYKEYDNMDISEALEGLKIGESTQLGSARCVTKISEEECYDVDTFNDSFRCVKRFKENRGCV